MVRRPFWLQGGGEMTRSGESVVRIFGVPMDLGQMRRGVDMGPSALRYAGLYERLHELGYIVEDAGNIHVPLRDQNSVRAHYAAGAGSTGARGTLRHLPEVTSACQEIFERARECAGSRETPIFLGGDHSIAIGTVAGVATTGRVGVLWIDAHGDFNTPETTPSGNIHGMPVAVLTGHGHPALVDLGFDGAKVRVEDVVMIAVRDVDSAERVHLASSGVTVFTMRDVDETGMANVAHRALSQLSGVDRIHVSLDMDAMDPDVAPGVGTPVAGGLTFREAHLLMEILSEAGKVRSLDVVEINPILDTANHTAELAVELVASLLGKRIM
jgi:arginase